VFSQFEVELSLKTAFQFLTRTTETVHCKIWQHISVVSIPDTWFVENTRLQNGLTLYAHKSNEKKTQIISSSGQSNLGRHLDTGRRRETEDQPTPGCFSNFRKLHSTHFNISSSTPYYGHLISINEQGKLDRWGNIMRPCSIALPSLRLQCSVTLPLLQIPALIATDVWRSEQRNFTTSTSAWPGDVRHHGRTAQGWWYMLQTMDNERHLQCLGIWLSSRWLKPRSAFQFPRNFVTRITHEKTRTIALPDGNKCVLVVTMPRRDGRMDKRADGQT